MAVHENANRSGSMGSITRRIALAMVIGLTLASAESASAARICGDYNRDEDITAADALGALRAAVEVVECARDLCDFTGDNVITSRDALAILKTAVGTGPEPNCPVAG